MSRLPTPPVQQKQPKEPLPPEQGNGAAPAYDAAQQGPNTGGQVAGGEDFSDEIPFASWGDVPRKGNVA